LEKIDGNDTVRPPLVAVQEGIKKWTNCLVGAFFGESSSFLLG